MTAIRTDELRKAEQAVIYHAMLNWRYEPVKSEDVGYSKRWDYLMRACERLARLKGKK